MNRRIVRTLFFLMLLASCTPSKDGAEPSSASRSPEITEPVMISPTREISPSPSLPPQPTPAQVVASTEEPKHDHVNAKLTVWSLGGNGWAVEQGDRFMIFDYVESTDPNPPAAGEIRDLARGYIDLDEIKEHEVYVFVTHSHPDHLDPVIYSWQDAVQDITYIFGWAANSDPSHHYMVGPRAEGRVGKLQVYTINTHHAGVPEVAYLVESDGIWIYHNGDYMASFQDDFEYMTSFTDQVHVAFLIGWPFPDHQQFQQALLFSDLFAPEVLFASCREGDEEKCGQFADMLADRGVDVPVRYAQQRGEAFEILLPGVE